MFTDTGESVPIGREIEIRVYACGVFIFGYTSSMSRAPQLNTVEQAFVCAMVSCFERSYIQWIRAVGGSLNFNDNGLKANSIYDDNDNDTIGVSACVSPE